MVPAVSRTGPVALFGSCTSITCVCTAQLKKPSECLEKSALLCLHAAQ